jgi:protein subunit release factor B
MTAPPRPTAPPSKPAPAAQASPPPPPPPSPSPRAAARRAAALPDAALLAECDESFFVGGGPGGQHRNKTASGVRLVHRPTGLTVTATERRSQLQNRGAALERLRARLAALAHVPKARRATKPTRGSKERRLAEKRRDSRRKAERRGDV